MDISPSVSESPPTLYPDSSERQDAPKISSDDNESNGDNAARSWGVEATRA